MGVEFKDKTMFHVSMEAKYRWKVGVVGGWERWKGNEVVPLERLEAGEWRGEMVGGS